MCWYIDFARLGKRLQVLHSASRTMKREERIEMEGDSVWEREVGAMHSCGFAKGRIQWFLQLLQARNVQVRREHSCIPGDRDSRHAIQEN